MARMSMDQLVRRGEDTKKEWNESVEEAQEISKEIGEIKEELLDMPGGLDDDILEQIRAANEQARQEARADMESRSKSKMEKAVGDASDIKNDTGAKISENMQAQDKLREVSGKAYGRDAISRASSSLDQNSEQGQDLISDLDRSEQDARSIIDQLFSNI